MCVVVVMVGVVGRDACVRACMCMCVCVFVLVCFYDWLINLFSMYMRAFIFVSSLFSWLKCVLINWYPIHVLVFSYLALSLFSFHFRKTKQKTKTTKKKTPMHACAFISFCFLLVLSKHVCVWVCVRARLRACACVRACVQARARARVWMYVCVRVLLVG